MMSGADYKPIKRIQDFVGNDKEVTIGNYRLTQENDATFGNIYLKYSNLDIQLIDSAECSAYGSMIYAFNSKASKDTLVIWSIEYENISVLHLYYLNNGIVLKIGELTPLLDCKDCDDMSYPVSSIKIVDNKSTIKLEFKKQVKFKDQISSNERGKNPFIVFNKRTL